MAVQFRLIADPNPTVYKLVTIASQAFAVGDLAQWSRSANTVTPATATTITANVAGVVMGAQVSTDTTALIALVTDQQTWAADNTNATVTTDNYQRMVLTDKGTVNNTHTDSTSTAAIWHQDGILASSRSVGHFLVGRATT